MESTILWRLTDGPPLRELMGARPPHRGDLRGSLRSLGTVRTLVCGPSRGGLRKGRRPVRRRPCPCRHLPNRVDFAMMRGTSTPRAQPGAACPPVKAIWGGEGSGWGEPQRGAAGLDSVAIWVPSWQAPRSCKRLVGMICVNSYCAPVSAAKCRSVGRREGPTRDLDVHDTYSLLGVHRGSRTVFRLPPGGPCGSWGGAQRGNDRCARVQDNGTLMWVKTTSRTAGHGEGGRGTRKGTGHQTHPKSRRNLDPRAAGEAWCWTGEHRMNTGKPVFHATPHPYPLLVHG